MALEGTTAILETHLLPKEELYKRWVGATDEEIAKHFNNGELRAYERHKGPINGILWCKPGHVYYQNKMDYSNPGLYEYHDDYCDYFLIEDVVRCETEHPEYVGNVTPESLGLVQTVAQKTPDKREVPHAGLRTLSSDEVINRLKITPIELVDILNGYNVYFDVDNSHVETKRLVTVDEEAFREHGNSGWNEKFFSVKALGNVKIYQVDFDRYCEAWGLQEQALSETVDTSPLEFLLAEVKKEPADIEGVRRWNKQFLAERAELQKALEERGARIAELEPQLAQTQEDLAATRQQVKELAETQSASQGRRDTSAATIARLRNDLQRWKGAVGVIALVAMRCQEKGPSKRSRTDIQRLCKQCGGELPNAQLEALRRALPDDHVDREDRANLSLGNDECLE